MVRFYNLFMHRNYNTKDDLLRDVLLMINMKIPFIENKDLCNVRLKNNKVMLVSYHQSYLYEHDFCAIVNMTVEEYIMKCEEEELTEELNEMDI